MQLLPPLLLLLLAVSVEISVQRGFWPGAVIGAGIALESAGIGYAVGRASRRHHHHRHHGYYGRRRRGLSSEAAPTPSLLLEAPQAAAAGEAVLEQAGEESAADPVLEQAGEESAADPVLEQAGEESAADPVLESAEMDAYFRLVAAEDLLGCGLRLVCELSAAEQTTMQDDQQVILALFGRDGPRSLSTGSPKQAYDAAHELGRTSGSAATCAAAFPSCPANADLIMSALRTVRR